MSAPTNLVHVLAAASLLAGPAPAAEDPLASYRDKSRLLVVLAAGDKDAELMEQRRIYQSAADGSRERDLLIVEAVDGTELNAVLRRRFDVPPGKFRAILVGKDGTAKLRSDDPIYAARLFARIDEMPMRREGAKTQP